MVCLCMFGRLDGYRHMFGIVNHVWAMSTSHPSGGLQEASSTSRPSVTCLPMSAQSPWVAACLQEVSEQEQDHLLETMEAHLEALAAAAVVDGEEPALEEGFAASRSIRRAACALLGASGRGGSAGQAAQVSCLQRGAKSLACGPLCKAGLLLKVWGPQDVAVQRRTHLRSAVCSVVQMFLLVVTARQDSA